MTKSKIDQTNINKGIPLTPQTTLEAAGKSENTVYMNIAGGLCVKRGGAEKQFVNPDGTNVGLDGIHVSVLNIGGGAGTSSSVPIKRLELSGSAISSYVENTLTQTATVGISSTTGGGGGLNPGDPAGGDLAGVYPNPILASVAGMSNATYHLPAVTTDTKGRISAISELGHISSPLPDDTLVFSQDSARFVNGAVPYKKGFYEGQRIAGGWDSVYYNSFAQASDFIASPGLMTATGGPAVYDIANKCVNIPVGGAVLTTNAIPCQSAFKILTDTSEGLLTHNIGYSLDGANWVSYTKDEAITLPIPPTTFYIRFSFSGGPGFFFSYGLLTSTQVPEKASVLRLHPTTSNPNKPNTLFCNASGEPFITLNNSSNVLPLVMRVTDAGAVSPTQTSLLLPNASVSHPQIKRLEAGTNIAFDTTTDTNAIRISSTGSSPFSAIANDMLLYNPTPVHAVPSIDTNLPVAYMGSNSTLHLRGIEGAGGIVIKEGRDAQGNIKNVVIDGSGVGGGGGGATSAAGISVASATALISGATTAQAAFDLLKTINSRTVTTGVTGWTITGNATTGTRGFVSTFCDKGFVCDVGTIALEAINCTVGLSTDETVLVPLSMGPVTGNPMHTYSQADLQSLTIGDVFFGLLGTYTASTGTVYSVPLQTVGDIYCIKQSPTGNFRKVVSLTGGGFQDI